MSNIDEDAQILANKINFILFERILLFLHDSDYDDVNC